MRAGAGVALVVVPVVLVVEVPVVDVVDVVAMDDGEVAAVRAVGVVVGLGGAVLSGDSHGHVLSCGSGRRGRSTPRGHR